MALAELIEQGLSREDALEIAVEQLGMDRDVAEFVLAVERGEIEGDVVVVEENESA